MSSTATLGNFPSHDSATAHTIAKFSLRDFTAPDPGLRSNLPTERVWRDLVATGTAAWLDTGDIDAIRKLWTQEFSALTTNNTLLNKEVQKGIYDDLVPEAAAAIAKADPAIDDDLQVLEIAFILNAVHGLKLVSNFDADVSVELHTKLARDAEATFQYGMRYAAVCPERFIVKVPLTPEGLIGARRLHDAGVRINFTLGFSARQNYLIANLAQPNFVNVFMGRNGAFVKNNGYGDGSNVGEKATLASQRALRELCRIKGLDVKQIGASIRSGQQCFDLAGLDVFTIPTGAAEEYMALDPATDTVVDQTANDPEVVLAAGHDLADSKIDRMWEVSSSFKSAVDSLSFSAELTGDAILAHLQEHGAGDVFPVLNPEEQTRISAETKIPKATSWQNRVAAGTASWDGLLTAAALASFHEDQIALDDRIRQSLGN